MTDTVNPFVASHKANMEALAALTAQAFAGMEKLVDMNMAASRAALNQSFSHVQESMGAKNPKEPLSLQSGLLKPLADKTAAYAQHLQSLVTQGGDDFAKAVKARAARSQETLGGLLDSLAGSETGLAAFKSAKAAGQSAAQSVQAQTRKTIETAQANFAVATTQAAAAVRKAAGIA